MPRLTVIVLGLVATISYPGYASAQGGARRADPGASGEEPVDAGARQEMLQDTEARQRFELASTLFDQGHLEEAQAEFERAYELSRRPELLYNLYLCARDTGDDQAAAEYLRRFLTEADEVPSRGLLEERLRRFEMQLELAEARAERERLLEQQRLAAEEAQAEAEREAERERQDASARRARLGPILTVTSGAVVLATGLGVGLAALLQYQDLQERCDEGLCPPDAQDDIDTLTTRNVAGDVVTSVGAAIAAAGVLWWALLPASAEPEEAGARLRIGPLGVGVEGCF